MWKKVWGVDSADRIAVLESTCDTLLVSSDKYFSRTAATSGNRSMSSWRTVMLKAASETVRRLGSTVALSPTFTSVCPSKTFFVRCRLTLLLFFCTVKSRRTRGHIPARLRAVQLSPSASSPMSDRFSTNKVYSMRMLKESRLPFQQLDTRVLKKWTHCQWPSVS